MSIHKKSKTTTQVVNERFNFARIVKFTYIETLALADRQSTAKKLTEFGKFQGNINSNNTGISRGYGAGRGAQLGLGEAGLVLGIATGASVVGAVVGAIVGKKKQTTSSNTDVDDSGWILSKVWNQPQFDIIRYAIGIKELTIAQFTYEPVSEFVSIPWSSPKEIIKVVVNTSEFIPPMFPPGAYIECYIKPTIEGTSWIRINPLGNPSVFTEDGNLVPRIVNFNMEKPISARVEDSYIYTEEPVKELLFKAVLKRPDFLEGSEITADSYSPILKSYRLLMTPRNGL